MSTDAICLTMSLLLQHKHAHLCVCECAALALISIAAMFIYARTHMDGCCTARMSLDELRCQASYYRNSNAGDSTYYGVYFSPCTRKSAGQLTKRAMAVVREGKCKCACAHCALHFTRKNAKLTKPAQLKHTTNVPNERRTKTKGEGSFIFHSYVNTKHARQHARFHVSMQVGTQPGG